MKFEDELKNRMEKIYKKKRARITVEISCDECEGTGKVERHTCKSDEECPGVEAGLGPQGCGETVTCNCGDCDGTGFLEEKIWINYDEFVKFAEATFYPTKRETT